MYAKDWNFDALSVFSAHIPNKKSIIPQIRLISHENHCEMSVLKLRIELDCYIRL